MTETIRIPYKDPSSEVVTSEPYIIVIEDDSIEVHARYYIIEKDEDTLLPKDVKVDSIDLIMKSAVIGVVVGRSVKYGDYLVKIYYGDRVQDFFFNTKSEAMELYVKLSKWRKAK